MRLTTKTLLVSTGHIRIAKHKAQIIMHLGGKYSTYVIDKVNHVDTYVGYSICLNCVCRGYISATGDKAATSHLFNRPQSKYGRVQFTGPGTYNKNYESAWEVTKPHHITYHLMNSLLDHC